MNAHSHLDRSRLAVLIPAAGIGQRLGQGPKALLELDGRPLLQWLCDKALQVADEVIIAAPADSIDLFAALCPGCQVIAGGNTRQASVAALAQAARRDWLVLHDVARPFVSTALLQTVADAAAETGCAGAFGTLDVPVARIENERVVASYRHPEVALFQAPQAFSRELLVNLVRRAEREGWQEQSTLQLALRAGIAICAVNGERSNIKLTTAQDWALAEHLKGLLR